MDAELRKLIRGHINQSFASVKSQGTMVPDRLLDIVMEAIDFADRIHEQKNRPARVNFAPLTELTPDPCGDFQDNGSSRRCTRCGWLRTAHEETLTLHQKLERERRKRAGMQKHLDELSALVHRMVGFQMQIDGALDDFRQRIRLLEESHQINGDVEPGQIFTREMIERLRSESRSTQSLLEHLKGLHGWGDYPGAGFETGALEAYHLRVHEDDTANHLGHDHRL